MIILLCIIIICAHDSSQSVLKYSKLGGGGGGNIGQVVTPGELAVDYKHDLYIIIGYLQTGSGLKNTTIINTDPISGSY